MAVITRTSLLNKNAYGYNEHISPDRLLWLIAAHTRERLLGNRGGYVHIVQKIAPHPFANAPIRFACIRDQPGLMLFIDDPPIIWTARNMYM